MPMPYEYRHPGAAFEDFLVGVMGECNFATRNPAYTTAEAVLHVSRKRLAVEAALRFAQVLPPVLCALFIKDWRGDEKPLPFGPRGDMTVEVKALRRDHNFSPDDAIMAVARVLRQHVDEMKFDAVLQSLPEGAVDFWRVE